MFSFVFSSFRSLISAPQIGGFKQSDNRNPYSSDEKYFAYFVLVVFFIFGLAFLPALLFPMEDMEDDGAVKVFRREMQKKYFLHRPSTKHAGFSNDTAVALPESAEIVALNGATASPPVPTSVIIQHFAKERHSDSDCGQDWAALHSGSSSIAFSHSKYLIRIDGC